MASRPPQPRCPANRKVCLLAYDGLATFEFGVVVEIFGLSRPELGVPWYELEVRGVERGPLRARGGFTLDAPKGLRGIEAAGTIVVPGWRDAGESVPAPLVRALRRAHERGARIVSVCSGVFVLAAAGLLDGKRATTHWRYAASLAERYPAVEVDADVLYVDQGSVLTSAGSAAGIDLCLHLVRRDYGAEVANSVARRLVVPPHREGGQAQYIETPVERMEAPPASAADSLAEIQAWMRAHLAREHSVASLARRARTSPRTFARRFRAATGTTPMRWLTRERVACAQRLLETTDQGLEWIAARAGFSSAQLLRLHFRRVVGTTPSAYRRTFRTGAARADR